MKKILPFLMLCFLCSCEKEESSNNQEQTELPPIESEFFTTSNNITGEEYEKKACETLFRALEMCYSTAQIKITTKEGRVAYYSMPEYGGDELADQFYHDLQQLAYSQDVTTRGVWSIGKSTVDWYKAVKNVDQLYRCAIVGASTQYLDKSQLIELYNTLMKHKTEIFRDWLGLKYVSAKFEAEYFSTPGRFWYHFTNGDLDNYAKRIYNTILTPQTLSDSFVKTDALHELAFELAANDLTPTRLMLSAAGPLIEAGFNTVFAADDLYGSAKLGYDILNDNTKLIIDFKADKLNTKTLMTAVNTNLGLLTTCIDKVISFDKVLGVKDAQDLSSVINSYCVEKELDFASTIKKLNNLISETLTDIGSRTMKVRDISFKYFEQYVKNILEIDESASKLVFGKYLNDKAQDGTPKGAITIDFNKDNTFSLGICDDNYEEWDLTGEYTITGNKIKMKVKELDQWWHGYIDNSTSSMNKYYEGYIECYKDHIVLTWYWQYVFHPDGDGNSEIFTVDIKNETLYLRK